MNKELASHRSRSLAEPMDDVLFIGAMHYIGKDRLFKFCHCGIIPETGSVNTSPVERSTRWSRRWSRKASRWWDRSLPKFSEFSPLAPGIRRRVAACNRRRPPRVAGDPCQRQCVRAHVNVGLRAHEGRPREAGCVPASHPRRGTAAREASRSLFWQSIRLPGGRPGRRAEGHRRAVPGVTDEELEATRSSSSSVAAGHRLVASLTLSACV